jgi:catechol 2,3-dioxygenase-like lactoylglutathione lyase family enzyme
MRFHHMALYVTDLDRAIRLWRDVLGFSVAVEMALPDGAVAGPTVFADARLLDDTTGVAGTRARMALLSSEEGALIELQQFEMPRTERTPDAHLRHAASGLRELGLLVEDIDGWFARIRAAGYETQTDYVWSSATLGRSFIFYDDEGNMIQLWENAGGQAWQPAA